MSILDESPFPLRSPQAAELVTFLASLYRKRRDALVLTEPFGIDSLDITDADAGQSPRDLWIEMLSRLAADGNVRALVEEVLRRHPKNPRAPFLRTLLDHQVESPGDATEIVFVATEWGATATGINAINYQLCCALAETHTVKCLVPDDKSISLDDAAAVHRVEVLRVPVPASSFLSRDRVNECEAVLASSGNIGNVRVVIGHDFHTGSLATELATRCNCPSVLLIYATHFNHPVGYGLATKQHEVLQKATVWAAVGPHVYAELAQRKTPQKKIFQLVPGLTGNAPVHSDTRGTIRIGVVGRLESTSGVMTQGNLAVAAAVYASRRIGDAPILPVSLSIFAPEEPEKGTEFLGDVRRMAAGLAGTAHSTLDSYGFVGNANRIPQPLGEQSVMLVPASQTGIGLSAWAAIDAAIPLVVWDQSGIAHLLREHGLIDRVTALPVERGLSSYEYRDLTAYSKIRVLNETRLPKFSGDMDAWTAAVSDILREPERYRSRAVDLRDNLLSRGFGWMERARLFARELPSTPARSTRRQDLERRKPDSRASAAFDKLLTLSNLFAEGFASQLGFRDALNKGELAVFNSMLWRNGNYVYNAVEAVARYLCTPRELSNLTLTGLPGTGKSLFLANVYWRLSDLTNDPALGLLPIFLDCDHPEFTGFSRELRGLSASTDISAFRARLEGRRAVFLVRGNRTHFDNTKEWRKFLRHSDSECTFVFASRVRESDDIRSDWEIHGIEFNADLASEYLNLAMRFGIGSSAPDAVEKAIVTLQAVCKTHRLKLSYALADICLVGLSQMEGDRRPATLAALMYHYGRKQLAAASADRESGDGPTFDSQIKELLSSAADAAHKSITRESRRDRRPAVEATAAVPGGLSALAQSLIDFFPSVRHWLAATSIVDKLVELGNLTLKSPASAADEERIAILCEALNFVYPTYVNAFVKEVVEARLSRNRNALENALLAILKGDVGGGRLLKASACYIVGRMRDSFTEFRPMLRQVITFTHRDLAEIEVLQQAVLAAKRNNATKCLVAFEKIVDALCGSGGPVDPLQKLDRGQKELLLLQRSAYISLGNLEDSQAAEEYIISLLADAQRDDLNRGFHLEYYGDLDYLPVDPLFSTDKKRGPWPRTLRALLTALSDGSHHVSAQMVPAVTLASLARHRHCYDNLQASDREKVLACLREVRRLRFPTRIAEFLESVIKELEHDMYVIERYVDDLYELKYQRRAGWEDLMPPESVAAHSYMAEFLAKLFVPDESSLDRQKVLEYIAFHDIGEAVTGDIVHGKKFAPERATEARIVRQISQLGALTRSAEFLRLAARFEMFEKTDGADLSDEVKLAKDCDHLDLLIQLFRYKRECADVPRFAEFRAYVEPSNFRSEEMKRWAARFVRYFERELEPPKVRGNGSLWLAEINRQRISGRPV